MEDARNTNGARSAHLGFTRALVRHARDHDVTVSLVADVPHALLQGAPKRWDLLRGQLGEGVEILSLADLPALFRDPRPTWPDGTPLKIILRARSGSEYPYLIKSVAGMDTALDEAHQRRGVPVGATDQENADLAQRTEGALAIASLVQIRAEKLSLQPLPLDDVEPSIEAVADGSYPFPFRICLLLPAQPSAAGQRFVSFVASDQGQDTLRSLGAVEETKVNP
jgi:hypothetical protein